MADTSLGPSLFLNLPKVPLHVSSRSFLSMALPSSHCNPSSAPNNLCPNQPSLLVFSGLHLQIHHEQLLHFLHFIIIVSCYILNVLFSCLTGGTAFNGVVEELKNFTTRVAHVLPVSDDGGSTAEIVRVLGEFV